MDSLPPRRAELALIGAGPHALSVLLGLLTDERQFLTDRESQRAERRAEVLRRPTRGRLTPDDLRGRVLVVDEHGEFCAQWRSYFAALEIDFLRSTAIMHPDPSHPDALLEHAFRRGTLATDLVSKNELFEGRTGAMARKSSAINAREIDHYALPSSRLFDSFISVRAAHMAGLAAASSVPLPLSSLPAPITGTSPLVRPGPAGRPGPVHAHIRSRCRWSRG